MASVFGLQVQHSHVVQIRSAAQVAGHKNAILVDHDGALLKPFNAAEHRFYEAAKGLPNLSKFIPQYFGQRNVESAQAGGGSFISMENITSPLSFPCILDLKLGTRQHGDDCSDEKIAKQVAKCSSTTSASLGVRCGGMRIRDSSGLPAHRDKHYGRSLTPETFEGCLREFFTVNGTLCRRRIARVVAELREIEATVAQLSGLRLYSSSLLICYDGDRGCTCGRNDAMLDGACCGDDAVAKMIDFGQTVLPGCYTGPDAGYLLGVRTLVALLGQSVESS